MPTIQWDDETSAAIAAPQPQIQWDDQQTPAPRGALPPAQEETTTDRIALAIERGMRAVAPYMESELFPMPSRQNVVDLAGGMAEMGGLLADAPRIQGTTTDSGWKTAGKILDPTTLAVGGKVFQAAKAIPGVARMTSPIAQNMIASGSAGAAVGAMNGEPLEGAAWGAAIPVVGGAVKGVAAPVTRRIGEMLDAAIMPGGSTRAAGRVATDVAKMDAQRIAQALQTGVSTETAAQAAAPVGRAEFAGLERLVGSREPSIFGPAGTVNQGRMATEKQAWQDLKALTEPERDAVLQAANAARSGIPLTTQPIMQSIDTVLQTPGFQANPAVQSVLGKYKAALTSAADPSGNINAHDLYTIRKTMGSMVESLADKEGWDKKLVRGLVTGIQKEIDFALERSSGALGSTGNTRWQEYLTAFKEGAKKIEGFGDRAKIAKMQGAAGAPEARRIARVDEVPATLPNLLSRPAMLVNAFMRYMSGYGGEKTTQELARLMQPQNKNELAALLERELAKRGQRGVGSNLLPALSSIESASFGTRE